MLEIASQMILCLLLAALLGFIMGYLFGKNTCAKDDCGHEETQEHSTHKVTSGVAPAQTSKTNASHGNAKHSMTTTKETSETKEASKGSEPVLLSGPRGGKKDNLTRIKGIGIKIDETLNNMGIYHFDQIASWTEEHALWVDSQTAFPGRVQREKWVEQAKLLASGKETEFSKRVDKGEIASSKKA